ncbi:hypothetical protein AAFF_G00329970, partial [Aldrovandia affinis]
MGLCGLDHNVPYSWDPPYVYRALRNFAFRMGLVGAGLPSWTYKNIMSFLRSGETMTLPRGSPALNPEIVWKNANHKTLNNKQKDITWMSVHGCLPTRPFLFRRHLTLTENCPHGCTDSEHVHHLFWECSVARRVWGLVV